MSDWGTTNWQLIKGAASGSLADRAAFADRYGLPLRAYFKELLSRWPGVRADVEDLVQDVFVECYRRDGALPRADPEKGEFQAFLLGVARNIARRAGDQRLPSGSDTVLEALPADDTAASRAYDRACAQVVMRQARARMEQQMAQQGDPVLVEILRLRSEEGLTLAQIAGRLNRSDIKRLNEEAKAAFERALLEVLAAEHPGASSADVLARARNLLTLLRR